MLESRETVSFQDASVANYSSEFSILTKFWICEILKLPISGSDSTYTRVYFAHDVQPGGVAVITVNTSVPNTYTSPERCVELADVAIARGAALLIAPFQIKDYPCLLYPDPVEAYCLICSSVRARFRPKTLSVTGSIGKTTTTQMAAAVLKSKYPAHCNDSSANNLRLAGGVVQRLKPEHMYYVQETMEGPPYCAAGVIAKVVQPQAAIVTLVGSSHLEAFGTQERILDSCLSVQEGMPTGEGLMILNGDDPFQWGVSCSRSVVYYGIDNEECDYRAANIRSDGSRLAFDVLYEDKVVAVTLNCFGRHNVLNALAVFAAGVWADMTDEEIVFGLASYRPSGIRQNLVRYGGHSIYPDCYNASPESMQSAFDAFEMVGVPEGGHRVAVLADMLETGEEEALFHRRVGEMVARSKIEKLICYGSASRHIADAARLGNATCVVHTECFDELISLMEKHVSVNDVLMVKGSHGMKLELAVDRVFGTAFHEEFERYEFRSGEFRDDVLRYFVYTDHATVRGKLASCCDVAIPETIEGRAVTNIARAAFEGSAYTKSVQFPSTLRNIGYAAFYQANQIERIVTPPSLRIIERSAFNSCAKLETVFVADGCVHIGQRAFAYCHNLTAVRLPDSIAQIEDDAFVGSEKVVLVCSDGSYADRFAKRMRLKVSRGWS